MQPGVGLLNGEFVQIFASPVGLRTYDPVVNSNRPYVRARHHFSPASELVFNVSQIIPQITTRMLAGLLVLTEHLRPTFQATSFSCSCLQDEH